MNIHEYQAKEILAQYGVKIPAYKVVTSIEQVEPAIQELKLEKAVVKIQVHAGGRGKAGGVKIAKSLSEIKQHASALLGMKMVNNQTGPQGVIAHQVMISELTPIKKEFYLGVVVDRARAEAVLIASPEGGMEIEEIAHKTPEKILKLPIRFDGVLRGYQLLRLANFMGWKGDTAKKGMKTAAAIAKAFIEKDASLLEINPLVESEDGDIWALDAKFAVDDNALFRHEELMRYYDPTQQSPNEVLAKELDLAYIALDGNIGCMVNGAGLAMATMDIIKHYGGSPANFLDVGGSASKEKVSAAFRIILSDPQVKCILINIFGGIMNCATLAEGILHAIASEGVKVPLVVRMEGTNVEEGKKLLRESNLKIITADSLADAAAKAVNALRAK